MAGAKTFRDFEASRSPAAHILQFLRSDRVGPVLLNGRNRLCSSAMRARTGGVGIGLQLIHEGILVGGNPFYPSRAPSALFLT